MKDITIIIGPTATGKTKYSIQHAEYLKQNKKKSIIINADASAVYKNFPVLTAQNSFEERLAFNHFLFEVIEINEDFSVGKWLQMVDQILNTSEFEDYHKIIVGGTCMYIFLLINGLTIIPEINSEAKQLAKIEYDTLGHDEFLKKVKTLDPYTHTDSQRLVNNYSLIMQTGRSFKEWQDGTKRQFLKVGSFDIMKINPPRDVIYENCNKRFLKMVETGGVDEVKNGIKLYGKDFDGKKIIGYNEIRNYILGECTLEEAIQKASQKTRNLAKRQITWLNNKFT